MCNNILLILLYFNIYRAVEKTILKYIFLYYYKYYICTLFIVHITSSKIIRNSDNIIKKRLGMLSNRNV